MRILLMLLLLAVPYFAQSPEVNVDYDKFQRVTRLRVEASIKPTARIAGAYVIKFLAHAVIPDNGKPDIYFYFTARPKWLLKRPTLRILVNGKLLEYETDDIDTSIVYPIPLVDFERIANAETVDIQLIPFDGPLDKSTIAGLKNLLTLTKPQPR